MGKRILNKNTFVIFIDNDDSYIRDVLARFEEVNNYNVKIYSRSKDFLEDFVTIEHNKKRIFVIFLSTLLESGKDNKPVNPLDVIKRIKEINSHSEVILYSENDDLDIVTSAFTSGAYTFIKKNENIILRIENNIKGILSQKNFLIKKESSKLFTKIFISFIAVVLVLFILFYLLFPDLFV